MQEINNSNDLSGLGFTPAAELTEITLTEDQHFELQFQNLMRDLMQEMHRMASIARNTYIAPFAEAGTTNPKQSYKN